MITTILYIEPGVMMETGQGVRPGPFAGKKKKMLERGSPLEFVADTQMVD